MEEICARLLNIVNIKVYFKHLHFASMEEICATVLKIGNIKIYFKHLHLIQLDVWLVISSFAEGFRYEICFVMSSTSSICLMCVCIIEYKFLNSCS